MAEEQVFLKCVQEGSKLRVKIISNGYFQNANCQFPRALREEGRFFSVPPSSVRLCNTGATYFYRINKPITILDSEPSINTNAHREPTLPVSQPSTSKDSKKRKQPEAVNPTRLPAKVYENDSPDCVICLDKPKEVILSPCGHFCLCNSCCSKLGDNRQRKCPMCRQVIACVVTPDMMR